MPVDTAKYTAVNELESKAHWVRTYKFACAIFALCGLVTGGIAFAKYIASVFTSPFWLGSTICGIWEVIVFGLQAKAIQNADFDLQKKVVYFFYLNLFVLPAWVGIGPLITVSLPEIIGGVAAFVFCAINLYLSHQVSNVFEGKGTFALKKEEFTKAYNP